MSEQKSGITNFSFLVFFVTILFGILMTSVLLVIDQNSLLYYGDAVSHLFISRRFVDSESPGLIQMGTVWLPLPHFMMLPFSLIDSLFSSGLAGLVNLPIHALSAVFIFKIIFSATKNKKISLAGGLLYASNLNILYLGITAMTEAPFLLFFIGSVYYLQKWKNSEFVLTPLIISSIFVSLSTLCRYEAWILPPFMLILCLFFLRKKQNTLKLVCFLIVLISFSGILFWSSWNQIIYGNPIEFANAEFYAASSQSLVRENRDMLYLQPLNVLEIYGNAAKMIIGPILVVGCIGFISYLKEKNKTLSNGIYLFLILPVLFTLFTMLIGIGEMNQWWFNARFATFLYPIAIILTGLGIYKIQKVSKKIIPLTIIFALLIFQIASIDYGVVTFIDAQRGWEYKQSPFAHATGQYIAQNYDGGKILILTGSSQAHRIMISSERNLVDFNEGIESFIYQPYFQEPWKYNRWIILSSEPDSDSVNPASFWTENMSQLEKYYEPVFENEYYKILKIKN